MPPPLVRLGLWLAREYCSAPARGLALVLPPGTGTGAGRPLRAAGARCARRSPTPAGGARGRGRGAGSARASGRARGAGRRAARRRRRSRAGPAATTAPCGASSGAAWWRSSRPPSRRGGRGSSAWAPRRGGARADGRPERGARGGRAARRPARAGTPLLLHGVTGSGKTEVYLRAVAAALERGRSAIVLVPEIALTPQTAGRFVERFGDSVAVMHSRLAARERYDEWWRMRRGEARVCVGPRSAIFAPFADLGLIVIDEEHDSSYKQEGDPRYDARVVAERRAREEGAVLLAGSATPRPESIVRYERLRCPQRVDGRRLPPVELVGMLGRGGAAPRAHAQGARRRAPPRREGDRAAEPARLVELPLVPQLRARLGVPELRRDARAPPRRRRDGLPPLRPPRARAARPAPTAARCRWRATARAPSSSSASSRSWWRRCPSSGWTPTWRPRPATAARAARFDAAPAGVLVGTQMVAKGHDFPAVTLAVVLDADSTLRFPDFRAEERTFALVAQLAGPQRARRARRPGDRAGARPRRPARCATRRSTTRTASSRASCGRREASATRPTGTWCGRCARRRSPAPSWPPPRRCASSSPPPGCRCSARRRCSAAGAATAPSSWCARRERAPAIDAVRAAVDEVAAERAHARRGLRGRRRSAVAPADRYTRPRWRDDRASTEACGGGREVDDGARRPRARP